MRTTVTLDPDVSAELQRIVRERGVSFKQALNEALRAGLRPGGGAEPYELPTYELGLRPGIDLDKASILAAQMEDSEVVRKLDVRK